MCWPLQYDFATATGSGGPPKEQEITMTVNLRSSYECSLRQAGLRKQSASTQMMHFLHAVDGGVEPFMAGFELQ